MALVSIEKEAWNTLDRLVNTITDLGNAHLDETNQDQAVMAAAIDELRSCWSMTDRWVTNRSGSLLGVRDPVENFYNDLYAKYCSIRAGEEYEFLSANHPLFNMLRYATVAVAVEDEGTANGWGPSKLKGKEDLIKLIHDMCNVTKDQVSKAHMAFVKKQELEAKHTTEDL